MDISFSKYQGAGNDFILIDNRNLLFPKENTTTVQFLCSRRFGIGADGLILLENSETSDFKMVYFNADGNESTLCGNGGRCIVAFAKQLGCIDKETHFEAIDGIHKASVQNSQVRLMMHDIHRIEEFSNHCFLDSGSPHHVIFCDTVEELDVVKLGRAIRYGEPYGDAGTNVNFVAQISPEKFTLRTYERGVENETFACGTGATAVAIAAHKTQLTAMTTLEIETLGGVLEVSFKENKGYYTAIYLKGPATFVYNGEITLDNV